MTWQAQQMWHHILRNSNLTHFSLETPKMIIVKQCRSRSDTTVCSIRSGSSLFVLTTGISIKDSNHKKLTRHPAIGKRPVQIAVAEGSTRRKWVSAINSLLVVIMFYRKQICHLHSEGSVRSCTAPRQWSFMTVIPIPSLTFHYRPWNWRRRKMAFISAALTYMSVFSHLSLFYEHCLKVRLVSSS